jgi:hypothetical protein
MTIWAQEAKVFQTIIVAISIHVVEVKRQRRALPCIDAAAQTPRWQVAFANQTFLERCAPTAIAGREAENRRERELFRPTVIPTAQMTLPGPVRCRQGQLANSAVDHDVITARRFQAQSAQDSSYRSIRLHRFGEKNVISHSPIMTAKRVSILALACAVLPRTNQCSIHGMTGI